MDSVLVDHEAVFGRSLTASEYAAATGEKGHAVCVASPSDDLQAATRRMVALDASVLLVARGAGSRADLADGGGALATADVLGVVTKRDLAKNVAIKSTLMARDRTL